MIDKFGNRWMQTYLGKQFYPKHPTVDALDITEIAHSLSNLCRYTGHCLGFYSVAEHCTYVSQNVSPKNAMWGLLHDAAEAYLNDISRPVKPMLINYSKLEANIMKVVVKKFNLVPTRMPEEVKRIDDAVGADEKEQIMRSSFHDWQLTEPPLGIKIKQWTPARAEWEFLERFYELKKGEKICLCI